MKITLPSTCLVVLIGASGAGIVEVDGVDYPIRPGQTVVHTSGKHGTSVLAPAARLGASVLAMHPAMTFTGTDVDPTRAERAVQRGALDAVGVDPTAEIRVWDEKREGRMKLMKIRTEVQRVKKCSRGNK